MAKLPRKFGDYYLLKKIATGGMAEVFLAQARSTEGPDKYVALKLIHPRYQENEDFHHMIVEEAKIAIQLTHKNIGQIFDLGHHEKTYFIVMEYIDGYDLSRVLHACAQSKTAFPFELVAFIGREICAALSYAHNKRDRTGNPLRLIHRDVSPQNLLIDFEGSCKLIDFGIAKVSTRIQQTQAGVIKGKFYYMSPEQAGADKVDQRSDLFSLGICLWETLAGRTLFRREGGPNNPLAILHEIRTMAIPNIQTFRSDCPPQLVRLIHRALSRSLDDRFQSASEMQASFNRALLEMDLHYSKENVSNFMQQVYGKSESTKEFVAPDPVSVDLMTRANFAPGDESVIFDPSAYEDAMDSATTVLPPLSEREPIAEHITRSEQHTRIVHEEELEQEAAQPNTRETLPPSPNETLVFEPTEPKKKAVEAKVRPRKSRRVVPLGRDPLFRLLIIGLLVLCVLSATLAYLIARRAKEQRERKKDDSTTRVVGTNEFVSHKPLYRSLHSVRLQHNRCQWTRYSG